MPTTESRSKLMRLLNVSAQHGSWPKLTACRCPPHLIAPCSLGSSVLLDDILTWENNSQFRELGKDQMTDTAKASTHWALQGIFIAKQSWCDKRITKTLYFWNLHLGYEQILSWVVLELLILMVPSQPLSGMHLKR